jgi:transporter family-2 protein
MLLFLLIAVLSGTLMPVQSRANAALGAQLHDPIAAATVSFGSGFLLLAIGALVLPGMRSGVAAIPRTLREGKVRWFFLLAGCIGAYFVFAQAMSVPMTGVALFTVAVVGGQTVSSLLVDHWGLGPGGRRAINAARILGAALMIVAVLVSVADRLHTGSGVLLWLLLPISAGFFMSFQQAANGHSAKAYASPLAATFVNFGTGFFSLAILWFATHPGTGFPALTGAVWMYVGGLCGCIFIAVNAWLIKHLGILVTVMAMIAGQLLGSLLLDLFFPLPGAHSSILTILGLLLTFLAMAVMNLRRKTR